MINTKKVILDFCNRLKVIRDDKQAQLSLEFLIILAVVILAAIAVGFYLKQVSAKNANQATNYQQQALNQ